MEPLNLCNRDGHSMSRVKLLPDQIYEAIHVDEVGLETGLCGPFRLRTVYHPIFRRHGREAATPWGAAGRIEALKDGEPVSEEVFRASMSPEDELLAAALRGLLPVRNYLHLGIDGLAVLSGCGAPAYGDLDSAVHCLDGLVQAIADVWLEPSLVYFSVGQEVPEATFACVANELKFRGIQPALGDFGTDQSSIARVEVLSPRIVALDRSMFERIALVPIAVRLMTSIVERLQGEGRDVLVTGIATVEELRVAVDMGANLLEGPLLRPARQAGVLFDMSPINLAALLSDSENVVRFVSTVRGCRDMPQSH